MHLVASMIRPAPPAEGCLGNEYDATVADICTPYCNAQLNCPPNYSCAKKTSGKGAVDLCIPGVPGFRCAGQKCVAWLLRSHRCRVRHLHHSCPLGTDQCAVVNTDTDKFVCVEGPGGPHCVTPRPFNGANCDPEKNNECRPERAEFCINYDSRGTSPRGECRVPCEEDLSCVPQGGLPHTCLGDMGQGGCFPGYLGLPCKNDDECFSGLCELVPADAELPLLKAERICTLVCGGNDESEKEADQQCDSPLDVSRAGFCSGGYCRGKQQVEENCVRNAQCVSGFCDQVSGVCIRNNSMPE